MTEEQRLEKIAKLYGGINKLGKAVGLDGSAISRRIHGEIKITRRDWICIEAAVTQRVEELQATLPIGI